MLFTGPTRAIISQIDEFLNKVAEAGLIFRPAIDSYLNRDFQTFDVRLHQIQMLEAEADTNSHAVENQMYSKSLIPENRGDVLGMLESTDNVIDTIKSTLMLFSQEHPDVPESMHRGFLDLAESSALATDALVSAERAFFRDVRAVQDLAHKVFFYEREADRMSDSLKRLIFQSNIELAKKMHLRYFATNVEEVSDAAENAAQRLSIYSIKRMM
ncbi:MAG: DUF47 family protein [bacterium]